MQPLKLHAHMNNLWIRMHPFRSQCITAHITVLNVRLETLTSAQSFVQSSVCFFSHYRKIPPCLQDGTHWEKCRSTQRSGFGWKMELWWDCSYHRLRWPEHIFIFVLISIQTASCIFFSFFHQNENLKHSEVPNAHLNCFSHLLAGEDGQIKIWSKSGMLRSTLASQGQAKKTQLFCFTETKPVIHY